MASFGLVTSDGWHPTLLYGLKDVEVYQVCEPEELCDLDGLMVWVDAEYPDQRTLPHVDRLIVMTSQRGMPTVLIADRNLPLGPALSRHHLKRFEDPQKAAEFLNSCLSTLPVRGLAMA